MKMKARMLIRRENGAAAVEFGIVLAVLVLLAVGVGEFGIMFYNKQVIVNASREGARAGIVRADPAGDAYTDAEIQDRAEQRAKNYLTGRIIAFGEDDPVEPDLIVNVPADVGAFGEAEDTFWVEVRYEHRLLVPSLFRLGTTLTLQGYTEMDVEPPLDTP